MKRIIYIVGLLLYSLVAMASGELYSMGLSRKLQIIRIDDLLYAYDANGNLQKDGRKSLIFRPNRLNLLDEVYAGDTLKARYTYLSDGTKLGVRDGSGRVVQQTDYYPFGARMYDAALCRWQGVDPMGEKYADLSPYNYCVNNPLVYVDPDGMMLKLVGNAGDIV